MANILKLSTRSSDLLQDKNSRPAIDSQLVNGTTMNKIVQSRTEGAPNRGANPPAHELLAQKNRMDTLEGMVNQRRLLGGTPQAEHFISELYSASQINRGPPGFSTGSRVHFDLLTGRDDRIGFSDYLNFEERFL
ncbi:unnamed protein product [Bursaphelenchus xylophilus]|uniref:(pine wood nematode) hypothetical protein n=1 Tax=Bursaphelenchus xylophilus TaxID=6326 RepID=A0A1I7RWD7_BURXY|nr:unnamed protein product [Bursaphelenchus xylophilus]CAG9095506.1 unnamed protein product [Bursaphelenchus xylophilus]